MISLLLTMFFACGDKDAEDTSTEEVVEETEDTASEEEGSEGETGESEEQPADTGETEPAE